MNGRVYDYNSGRFLSVDPFISMPGNSQASLIDGNKSFVHEMAYDLNYGRVKGEKYPSDVIVEYKYNSNSNSIGMALETRDFVADLPLRQVNDFDAHTTQTPIVFFKNNNSLMIFYDDLDRFPIAPYLQKVLPYREFHKVVFRL